MFSMEKRFFLFAVVNILIIVTISLVLNLLGVRPYMTAYGIDYDQLAVFCLVWGGGGALISSDTMIELLSPGDTFVAASCLS